MRLLDEELGTIEADALRQYTAISPALSRQAAHTLKLAGAVRKLLTKGATMSRVQETYLACGRSTSPEGARDQAHEEWSRYKEIVAESLGARTQDADRYVQVEHAAPSLIYDGECYVMVVAITHSYEPNEYIGYSDSAEPQENIKELLRRAATIDGEHHKQWALVEALRLLGGSVDSDVYQGVPF
jgi:hypothetical protein